MYRFLLSLFFIVYSYAAASQIEMFANKIEHDDNRTLAEGDIRLISNSVFIRADVLMVDKKTKCIEAFGNISIFQNDDNYAMTDYLYMDMQNNYSVLDKFFYITKKDKIWISSKEAEKKDRVYTIRDASTSTCNPASPDWTIGFSTGVFDEEEEWIDLYNPIIYAGKVPVFYFPYLGFPTSTKRRSGLLKTVFGNSEKEGMVLKQPIYLAPDEWWDATFVPEIRTNRGTGFFGELRIADSADSKGILEIGEFKDYKKYTKREKLQNAQHYGFNINYVRSSLLSGYVDDSHDGLYIDLSRVNDIDYLSIQDKEAIKIVPSKLNYLIYTPKNYFGINAKYFIDTTKPRNDETLQILPQMQYHNNTNTFISDNLTYSFDYKFKNYSRETGLTAKDHAFTIPVSYSFSLFEKYLNFLISENLYYYRIDYSNIKEESLINGFKDHGNVYKSNHFISAYTDLAREYGSFFHNMNLSVNYLKANSYDKHGYFDETIYTVLEDKDRMDVKFSQYWIDDGESVVTHRASQTYMINDDDNITTSDFENELVLKLKSGVSFNSLVYVSNEYDRISKATHTLRYTIPKFMLAADNIYEMDLENNKKKTDYSSYRLMLNPYYKHHFNASYSYDNILQKSRGYSAEYRYEKRCWDFSLSFNREIRPSLSEGEINSNINDIIYLKVNLNPFLGFEQKVYEYERDG